MVISWCSVRFNWQPHCNIFSLAALVCRGPGLLVGTVRAALEVREERQHAHVIRELQVGEVRRQHVLAPRHQHSVQQTQVELDHLGGGGPIEQQDSEAKADNTTPAAM